MWIFFVLAGVAAGILAGMGMGGGTLLIPILTMFLGVSQHMAQGINLLVFVPTALVAVILHAKNKLLDYKTFFIIILPAIASSVGFAFLANCTNEKVLKLVFGIFLIALGIFMFVLACVNAKKKQKAVKKS